MKEVLVPQRMDTNLTTVDTRVVCTTTTEFQLQQRSIKFFFRVVATESSASRTDQFCLAKDEMTPRMSSAKTDLTVDFNDILIVEL